MRKLFLITTLFSFGCLFSQTKKEEKAKVEVLPARPLLPHISTETDTTKVQTLKKEDSNSRFYKNMTDEKASQYKMLKKITPSTNYQTESTQPFKIDTIQNSNKIKPQGK
ncbi:hypothetical protein [Chryseobacterium sp. FH1]|uniref:hypothetical protein n=1 Tax=Chryseobacterium sp. FH1 TaxID=1233951 RepID=UPI0004E41131|nr:hypothetical protein [Chryseobacterium sp. FH1]KFC22998.1 hypothetical protein IO90_05430 [Chryseobacterium sp. FH1]